jgi:outer membrane protein OmpA-like peptidoglycan-associated protein
VSQYLGEQWQNSSLVGRPFNRVKNGTGGNVTPDGNQMLVKGYYRSGKWLKRGFSIAYKDNVGWTDPEPLEIKNFGLYSKGGTDYGYLCNDGRTLIFDADPVYGSYKNDLFVTFLLPDGTWSEPKNLGPDVNATDAYTVTPFLAADNRTLYFSSNGWPGYGDNDVFMSKRLDDTWTKWSEPVNLGTAINSPKWDAYFNADAAGKYSYLTSKRNTTKAKIYRIDLAEVSALDPILLVKGHVFNTDTQDPIGTNIIVTNLVTGEIVGSAFSNPVNGFYEVVLPKGIEYGFFAESRGFLSVRENLNVIALNEYQEVEQNLGLAPIKVGQKIELRNVFFVRAKSVLMPKSLPELNQLVQILNENLELRISIHGHTSNTGTVKGNVTLSEERAIKIKTYLVSKGISASRLETKGFGPHQPIAPNDSEINRRKNRRVEFIVL